MLSSSCESKVACIQQWGFDRSYYPQDRVFNIVISPHMPHQSPTAGWGLTLIGGVHYGLASGYLQGGPEEYLVLWAEYQ